MHSSGESSSLHVSVCVFFVFFFPSAAFNHNLSAATNSKLWVRVTRVAPCATASKSPHFNITPQERAQFDSLRQFFIGNWGTAGGEKVYFSKPSVGESWPEYITDWYVIIKHWPSGCKEEDEEEEEEEESGWADGCQGWRETRMKDDGGGEGSGKDEKGRGSKMQTTGVSLDLRVPTQHTSCGTDMMYFSP